MAPAAGAAVGKSATITYKATDQNDLGAADEKAKLGLISKPVSIYYSDKIAEWDHTLISPADKVLIASGLSASGSYVWDASALKPGVYYRIIVDAQDQLGGNNIGETVSEPFLVDFDAPEFSVAASPASTRGADVVLRVTPNKDLGAAPTVTVTQHGGKAVTVVMKKDGDDYVGTYKVVAGQDGIAEIAISGADLAGNKGNTIVSGGTFAVGVDAPPAPKLLPLPSILGTSSVRVEGTARNDTTVVLKVNGTDTYTASVARDGTFSFGNIKLLFDKNRGNNTLSVVARDASGIVSEAATAKIKFNKAPTISLLPPAGAVVGGTVLLDAAAVDANLDPLAYTYQVLLAKDFDPSASATSSANEWVTVADAVSSHAFSWDSSEVEDGTYMLRAKVSDGVVEAYTPAVQVTIKNTLPTFKFEDGRKTFVATSSATIVGRALTPDTLGTRPTIAKVEYSVDQGKKWLPAKIISGASTGDVRFSINLSGLTEGVNGLMVRALDSRKLYGRASHPVVLDTTAPAAPTLNLRSGSVVTSASDSNLARAGMQIVLAGHAEAGSMVTLVVGGTSKTQKTDASGNFVFADVELVRGANTFTLTATDPAGNAGAPATLSLIYDNAPEILFLEPKASTGLSGDAKVSWRITDADNDALSSAMLSYRKGGGNFIPLTTTSENSFVWNVSRFAEGGDYELRLAASDGLATSTQTIGFYIDKTAPSLSSFALATPVVTKGGALKASGAAADALSGVEYVEYAVSPKNDSVAGLDWVRALLSSGYLKRSAAFSINRALALEDGAYTLSVRAVDASGNVSSIETGSFVVDSSPPRIGSFGLEFGGVSLAPSKEGALSLVANKEATFAISLEDDTQLASITYGATTLALLQNPSTGLWEGYVSLPAGSAPLPLLLSATDRLGNSFDKKNIGTLTALDAPRVMSGSDGVAANIAVFAADPTTGDLYPFITKDLPSGSLKTDASGSYILALPQGSYTLVMQADGYATQSQKVSLERPQFVGVSFETKQVGALRGVVQNVLDYFTWGL